MPTHTFVIGANHGVPLREAGEVPAGATHTFVVGANHGVPREAGEVPAGAHAETILGPLQRPSLVQHPGD